MPITYSYTFFNALSISYFQSCRYQQILVSGSCWSYLLLFWILSWLFPPVMATKSSGYIIETSDISKDFWFLFILGQRLWHKRSYPFLLRWSRSAALLWTCFCAWHERSGDPQVFRNTFCLWLGLCRCHPWRTGTSISCL